MVMQGRWVGIVGLLPSAPLPTRQHSRTQRVVRTSRTRGRGRALVWVASTGPSLANSSPPLRLAGTSFPRGALQIMEEVAQRAQAQEWRALCLQGTQLRRMLSSPPRRELRQGTGPRVRVPRHTRSRRLLGTHSSRQSPEPLVPVAAGTGMSPSGRARGCQGHYKFPLLHKAQPRPRADNKRLSSLPHRLCRTSFPTPEPKPGAGQKQRSSTQPLPVLEG